mmetsp:Transcript_12181/g.28586  ORF Transcript_12181/g.28586 Transcript_12181/m.28586 type:complete len:221 (+) Transcript_12181:875-1537(+)
MGQKRTREKFLLQIMPRRERSPTQDWRSGHADQKPEPILTRERFARDRRWISNGEKLLHVGSEFVARNDQVSRGSIQERPATSYHSPEISIANSWQGNLYADGDSIEIGVGHYGTQSPRFDHGLRHCRCRSSLCRSPVVRCAESSVRCHRIGIEELLSQSCESKCIGPTIPWKSKTRISVLVGGRWFEAFDPDRYSITETHQKETKTKYAQINGSKIPRS